MMFNRDDPKTWGCFRPLIIAHDVGRSRDRSTAVIGGLAPFDPNLIGIQEAHELRQGSYGSARASELATIDRRYDAEALIVADLSNDPTYAGCYSRRLARAWLAFKSAAMAMARTLNGGRSKIRRCWFTPLAAPICSNFTIRCCSLVRSELSMDQRCDAPTSSSWHLRLKCARAGSSILARQGTTMTSAYPAPC